MESTLLQYHGQQFQLAESLVVSQETQTEQVKNNANLASILSNLTDPVRSRKDDSDFEDIDDEVSSDSDISSDSLDEEED